MRFDLVAALLLLAPVLRAGIEPGDFRKILIYNKDRVFAFAMTMGHVTEEWYANGLAVVNYGFPVIADTSRNR